MVGTEFNGNKINWVDYWHGALIRAYGVLSERLQDLNSFNDPVRRFIKPTIPNFLDYLCSQILASQVCLVC